METKVVSFFLLLVSSIFFVVSISIVYKSNNAGKFSGLRAMDNNSKLGSFSNIFPDRNLVLDMIQLSRDIYHVDFENGVPPEDAIDPEFQYEDWIEPDFSTVAMIVTFQEEDSSTVPVIIFRGSDEPDDWRVNLDSKLVKSEFTNAPNDVEVHQGFQSALFDQNVVQDIEEKVLNLVGENGGNIIVTGHSLGGANAHITATYLADRNPKLNIRMINFAAPRLGNGAFKLWTETKLTNLSAWRFVYRKDIVPRITPRNDGYRHAGHLSMLYRSKAITYYRQVGDEVNYRGAPWNWYYASSIQQHYAENYLSFIKDKMDSDQFWPSNFERRSLRDILGDMIGFKKIAMAMQI